MSPLNVLKLLSAGSKSTTFCPGLGIFYLLFQLIPLEESSGMVNGELKAYNIRMEERNVFDMHFLHGCSQVYSSNSISLSHVLGMGWTIFLLFGTLGSFVFLADRPTTLGFSTPGLNFLLQLQTYPTTKLKWLKGNFWTQLRASF